MKQWIFKHIIIKLFGKEFTDWFHKEVYEPLTEPLDNNWMDDMSTEQWNFLMTDINNHSSEDLMKTNDELYKSLGLI